VCVCLPSGGSSSPACTHRPQARPQLQISTHPESSTVQQAPPSYWYFGTGSITVPCPRPASPYASIAYFLLLYVVLVQDPGVFCHLPFIWCKNMRLKRGSLTLSLSKTICAEGKSCFARAIHLCSFLCKTHVTHVLTSDSRRAGCQWSQAQRVTCALLQVCSVLTQQHAFCPNQAQQEHFNQRCRQECQGKWIGDQQSCKLNKCWI